ncbi:hypothetical protein pb186bvf_009494 [Paramecium bursaria]
MRCSHPITIFFIYFFTFFYFLFFLICSFLRSFCSFKQKQYKTSTEQYQLEFLPYLQQLEKVKHGHLFMLILFSAFINILLSVPSFRYDWIKTKKSQDVPIFHFLLFVNIFAYIFTMIKFPKLYKEYDRDINIVALCLSCTIQCLLIANEYNHFYFTFIVASEAFLLCLLYEIHFQGEHYVRLELFGLAGSFVGLILCCIPFHLSAVGMLLGWISGFLLAFSCQYLRKQNNKNCSHIFLQFLTYNIVLSAINVPVHRFTQINVNMIEQIFFAVLLVIFGHLFIRSMQLGRSAKNLGILLCCGVGAGIQNIYYHNSIPSALGIMLLVFSTALQFADNYIQIGAFQVDQQ